MSKKEEEMIKKYTRAITAARRLLEKHEEKKMNEVEQPHSRFVPVPMAAPEPIPEREPTPLAQFADTLEPRMKPRRAGKYVLDYIHPDYYNMVLVMRWIEFLFERIKRSKLTLVLDYYKDIGWISDMAKSQIMSCARGEIQESTPYEEEITMRGTTTCTEAPYDDPEGWRLSAEDHLKSLLFIEKIAGRGVSKDELNSLEQEIKAFKRSLEGFHGV